MAAASILAVALTFLAGAAAVARAEPPALDPPTLTQTPSGPGDDQSGGAAGLQARRLILATGPVDSFHFTLGGAIQRVANASLPASARLRLLLEATAGSAENLGALAAGSIDLALVRSDVLMATRPGTGVQVLGAFVSEHLTLLVRRDSQLISFRELAAGQVSQIGVMGSDIEAMLQVAWIAHGLESTPLPERVALDWPADAGALCEGRVQVVALAVAHPNRTLARIGTGCEVSLVAVAPSIAGLIAAAEPGLVPSVIPASFYGAAQGAVPSFGRYVAVTVAPTMAEGVAFDLARVLEEFRTQIQRQHPMLYNLSRDRLPPTLLQGLLHPGAARYFREAGALPAVGAVAPAADPGGTPSP